MADRYEDFEVNSPRWLSLENFEGEIWKDVVGFEGLYLVSNCGRIKTVARIQPCIGKKGCDSYVIIKEKIKKIADNGLSRNFIYSATYARSRTAIINGYKFSYYKLNN